MKALPLLLLAVALSAGAQDEKEKPLRVGLPVVYDEAGTVSCYDTKSEPPIQRKMTYVGYEKDRGTVRYRCPAVYEGFECKSQEKCNGTKTYGLNVRIKIEEDFRRFPAIPSKHWRPRRHTCA